MPLPRANWLVRAAALVWVVSIAAAPDPAWAQSRALRQKVVQLVKPEFDFFAWSPLFHASAGLVYDNRPEPCALEIARLQTEVMKDPEDAAKRLRLGWLLNRHGGAGSGNVWLADAAKVCQRRLDKDPADEGALIQMALLHAGTEEGEAAARKATQLHPESWRAWDALARHLLRRIEVRVLGNLPTTPQEMAASDFRRLEKALRAHAADAEFATALDKLEADREAAALQAVKLAPKELEPLMNHLQGRLGAVVIVPAVRRLSNRPVQDRAAFDAETLQLLARVATLAADDPERLGVLGFIEVQIRIATAEMAAIATKAQAPVRPQFSESNMPVLGQLRKLVEGSDERKAVAATEAYAGLLTLIRMSGGEPPQTPNLPGLIAKAVEKEPLRPLLWDLLLGLHFTGSLEPPLPPGQDTLSVAHRRLKHLPTGRSHALIAFASDGEAARIEWTEAAKLEPTNIEYLLNLAVAFVTAHQMPENIDTAIALVQRATELGYADFSWQKPRLEAFRLRTYAACLILRGELERAHALLIDRLREFPGDIASREIRDALVND